ncbi:MAG: helix-turn-helix domain-containing protein [Halolamina sp.]
MPSGIRVELAVDAPERCPVAAAADGAGPIAEVSWADGDDTVVEEFRVGVDAAERQPESFADAKTGVDGDDGDDGDDGGDGGDSTGDDPDLDAEAVVDVGDQRVFRFKRSADADCACAVVEALDAPVANVRAADGTLLLTMHLRSRERLREVVAALEEVAERITVRYLVQGTADPAESSDTAVVDRGRLTDRQREVLRTAHRMGYFDYPGGANATAVADELSIGVSTFSEHLSAAQSKLLTDLLRPGKR